MATTQFMDSHKESLRQWLQGEEVKREIREAANDLLSDLSLAGEENFRRLAGMLSYMAIYGRASSLAE